MREDEITAENTAGRMAQVLAEVEALRMEMGRNQDPRRPMLVRNATPREVFYHARTMLRKANQLCIQLGDDSEEAPDVTRAAETHPADVLRIIDATRERLGRAHSLLHLEGDIGSPELPGPMPKAPGKAPSDVLAACLVAGRQLNVLLTQSMTSREAYERVATALGLVERLLSDVGATMPAAPALERRKFPREVFHVLTQTCDALHRVLSDAGVKTLELREGFAGEEASDVYDMVSLIVSELEYACALRGTKTTGLPASEPPSPTLPAHTYRCAKQLHAAVLLLAEALRSRPNWFAQKSA